MSSPEVTRSVPSEFWTESIEKALFQSLDEFDKYKDLISRDMYLEDFMGCLVSFGIRGVGS